ncbi:hypothetical protein [Marinobacter salsuginis]|uniref:Uncharacterized protein n=1 Tax=Marinobacter salsuginis TaxID=418719 RepID=A0A5M3Q0D0_9GAMM|nr:hypothetical protein [Marinobacter salsuginis]GBO88654.1 hypothetical protein MSSD14B_23220 [Marinobacter salsuginis]
MADSTSKSEIIERLIESNARLSRLLELAHAENHLLEKEIQSSKTQIAGLLAGINFSTRNQKTSSIEVVNVMLQAMMNKPGSDNG